MMSLEIKHPPADTVWEVHNARILHHPATIASDSLPELRSRVAAIIREGNRHREAKKRIKNLSFRYETDEQDMVTVVHVLFDGYKTKKIRAMKLTRKREG